MRPLLLMALAIFVTATLAGAQGTSDAQAVMGRISDITFKSIDIVFPVSDVAGKAGDVAGKPGDVVGKVQALSVKETPTEIRIELAADVLFDFDKSNIKPEAASALHNVAEIITDKGKGRSVRIEGHTDGKGSDTYNQRLSEQRAASVKQWLAQKEGIRVNMATQGFGAHRPVAPNTKPDGSDDPDGRQKNRRVEIVVGK